METRISNISEFVNCIHDFIVEEYDIVPRDFETNLIVGDEALIWHKSDGRIESFECPYFNRTLHIHTKEEISNNKDNVICCNEIDIITLKYLESSIFGPFKNEIIASLHSWLPAATYQHVNVKINNRLRTYSRKYEPPYEIVEEEAILNRSNDNLELKGILKSYNPKDKHSIEIQTYFEPSYLFHYLYNGERCAEEQLTQIYYNYYLDSNIVRQLYCSYTFIVGNDKPLRRSIMVRARSRSRSRSASPVATRRKRRNSRVGKKRARSPVSRRRSRSPSTSNRRSMRRRSRSRSRSRSPSRSRSMSR